MRNAIFLIMEKTMLTHPLHILKAGLIVCVLSNVALAESRPEPDAALADTWWPPQRNVWTPIGWPNHLFRFNVIYNGTVVAQPHVFKSRPTTSTPMVSARLASSSK